MKKILIVLFALIILGGLGFGAWYLLQQKSAGTFHQLLASADTAEITFTDALENKTYKKVIQYQPQVWLLTGTITDTNVPNMQCDFTGSVQFFAKEKALFLEPAAINLDPQCQQIAFQYNGKIYHKRLMQEGVDYLKDILVELKSK
ncbi:MAG: hypothetical protein A3B90_00885 [Candidatus Magasanikbacteria bacterium RIFCSPHIGHO2_02_FULL_41_13]|uniref:Uncharacterized protein n=1 Tax=Candidatus Magasanikbacteria bacterium RIFCSPHIGHO2_02_FULL_41_13 TaxID=1798676 RepID=A0A1F6M4M2_9BACT|nr:MAG: hypothetical protein A3B90_00885 [Candidatus Magasanikbacteria bacterium RIFCSPHIGHO2_02_FULL_41_13]